MIGSAFTPHDVLPVNSLTLEVLHTQAIADDAVLKQLNKPHYKHTGSIKKYLD